MYDAVINMGGTIDDDSIPLFEPCPKELVYLYNHWSSLRRREPISYVEIAAYVQLVGSTFTPWEIRVIIDLDCIFEASRNGNNS